MKIQDDNIYALTPNGERELHGETSLTAEEIGLLVMVDGIMTLGQIKTGSPMLTAERIAYLTEGLLDRGLLCLAESDPFADQFQIELDKQSLNLAGADADACALSLSKTGYYVNIARKAVSVRTSLPGQSLSVVVVEDEPLLAKFIQSYLSLDGFNARIASNRAEVVAEFRKSPIPDLILLDVMLPDADGFDILLRLRQHPVLKKVPVIMLTGMATREAVIRGLAGGADGYITKPFEADTLMRTVRTVVGLPDGYPVENQKKSSWDGLDVTL